MPDVRLPNGKVIRNVPRGTPKAQIRARAISEGWATEQDFSGLGAKSPSGVPSSSPSPERPFYSGKIGEMRATTPEEGLRQELKQRRIQSPFTAIGTAFENLVTGGYAPQLKAAASSILPGEENTYENLLARYQAEKEDIQEASPGVYKATQTLAPMGFLGAGPAMGVISKGMQIAGAPAIEGGLSTFSQEIEAGATPGEALEEATISAGLSGTFGVAGASAGAGVRAIKDKIMGRPEKARKMLKEHLEDELGMSKEEALSRVKDFPQSMIADLSPDFTYVVASKPGKERQQIVNALKKRQKGEPITGEGSLKQQFGDVLSQFDGSYNENFYSNIRKMRENKSLRAKESYELAFNDKIRPTDEMLTIAKTPIGQKAINKAKESYQNEMMLDEFPFEDLGKIDDLRFWNNVKKEFDNLADYTPAGQKIYKKADRSPENVYASNMAGKVRSELKNQSKAYKGALAENAEFQRMDEGMRLGKDIYRMNTDEIEDKMANLTVPKNAVKIGVIQAVKEQVQRLGENANVPARMTRNDTFKSVLKEVIPDKAEYNKFMRQIQVLEDQAQTYGRVVQTVPTAQNLRAMQALEGQPGAVGQALNLQLGTAAQQLLGQSGIPRTKLAQLLMQQGPEAAQALERVYAPTNVVPGLPGFLGITSGQAGPELINQ